MRILDKKKNLRCWVYLCALQQSWLAVLAQCPAHGIVSFDDIRLPPSLMPQSPHCAVTYANVTQTNGKKLTDCSTEL